MGKKSRGYFKGVSVPLLWWNGAEVTHSPRRLCNLLLTVWFGEDASCLRYCKIRNYGETERPQDQCQILFRQASFSREALRCMILYQCGVYGGRNYSKRWLESNRLWGGGGKSGVMRWQQDRTAVDLFLFLSKPALILDREIQSGEAVALTYSRQFGNVSFPRSFVFCRKRRSTPQCSAEFGLLSLSAPHWLGPRKPRLLPRPSGAFSERVGLCDAGVTLPQRYKRPCRRRGLLHEPPARGQ